MSRLDEAIASVAYILDCLMAYRNIVSTGDCNNCKNKDCQWKPKPGQLVRYNCPHYKAEALCKVYDVYVGRFIDEKYKDPCAPPERYKEITADMLIQNAAKWFCDGNGEE